MKRSKESIISEICLKLIKKPQCSGIQQCVELIGKELGAEGGLVLRTNDIPFLLEMRCCWDPRDVIKERNMLLDYSECPENELLNPFSEGGMLKTIEDVNKVETDPVTADFYKKISAVSFAGCTMMHDEDYLGGMCFFSGSPRIWTDEDNDLISEAVAVIANVVARIKMDESMQYLLEETNRRITDADRAKARFMNSITNGMRTPLNAAMGMITIMRHNIDNISVMDECIGRMETQIRELIGLVGDFADMSLVSGSEHLVNRIWISLETLISGVRKFIDPLAAGKNQRIEYEYDPEISVLADEVKIARIMINALGCSCRYSDEDTDIYVSLRVEKAGTKRNMLIISIKDENDGYNNDSVLKVFDPFSNMKDGSGRLNSAGIAMAVTKHMSEVMNGTCEFFADSSGTEFIASIPVEINDENSNNPEKSVVEKPEQEYNEMYIGRRILIVEDNIVMGEVLATLMGYRGLETDVVLNGKEACEAYETHEPFYYDMIFMDIKMPEMDGAEAAKIIRESGAQDASIIPIIALSATSLTDEEERAMNYGMNAYLHKPVDENELFETINRFLI
ncbi:MAG: response regulator [Lachnospiraceae bacterium]|nr:response regulator [Lachnospiraceae bacterium]